MHKLDAAEEDQRRTKPENEIPVPYLLNAPVISNADTAMFLGPCQVYSTGVLFELQVVVREARERMQGHGFFRDVLFGVELPDGTKLSSLDSRQGLIGDAPYLSGLGGRSGGRWSEQAFFLSPLPPKGVLRLVYAFLGSGLPEARAELSADEILDCATGVRQLWPWEPEPRPPAFEPRVVPADSWFAREEPGSTSVTTLTRSSSSFSSGGFGIRKTD